MSQRYPGGLITNNGTANASVLFNGSSSLTLAGASQYAIANSTTPFTIEYWIKPSVAGGVVFTEGFTGAGNTVSILCSLCTGTDVSAVTGLFPAFGWWTGSAWVTAASSTTALVLNVWSHVALVFTGSTSSVYINGINVTKPSSPTPAITWGVTGVNGDAWYVSRAWGGATDRITGNLSNLRFVNGTAVYTANFPVPVNLLAITNTALLTCQPNNLNNFITDNSSYGASITNTGPATVVPDNPFIQPPPYNPALGAATPGVWELNEAAAAAAQRSWNMYDPFFNRNTAMVHGNGTNGATNNTFLDSSTNNFTVTRNGNTTQGTFTPFSLPAGYWSNTFDGSGDYLQIAGNSNLAFGTGNFTIECFFNLRNTATSGFIYDARTAINQAVPCILTGGNVIQYYVSGATRITSGLIASSKWYHLVISRVSGSTRMFLDGVQTGATYTDATNYINNTNRPLIGTNGDAVNFFCNGDISNLRVLKGTGTTAPTVPTAPLTAVTNTQLLTCQNNRFIDSSANAYVITRAGDTRVVGFSPFYNPTAYLPEKNGGGIFFDGTGDFLNTPSNTAFDFWAGSFTFECWFYPTNSSILTNCVYFSTGTATTGINFGNSGSNTLLYSNQAGGVTLISGTGSTLNAWNHIALTKSGSTFAVFVNGVRIGTSTSTLYPTGNQSAFIGANSANNAQVIAGYLSSVRLVKGSAVYDPTLTTLTIPTAPLTAITNTQLLLSGTNASFIDNAANLTIETFNTSISTTQSKYGGSSMSFNGTSSYARLNSSLPSVVTTLGDFTVEGWFYLNSLSTGQEIFYINGNNNSYAAVRLDVNATSGNLTLLASTTGSSHTINVTNSTSPMVINRWTHLAVVRTGGAFIVYFNGTSIITSTTIASTTAVMAGSLGFSFLGGLFNATAGQFQNFLNGYINDFRTTNSARYTGNFTPPTSTLQNQ